MRYRTLICLTPALILSVAACGSENVSGPRDQPAGSGSESDPVSVEPAGSKLTVEVRGAADAPPRTYTLTCDPVGGDHPDAEKACAAVKAAPEPFATPPENQMCTKIYGGPQVATVKGTWAGAPVEATYGRGDGCHLARWEKLSPLFGPLPKAS